MVFLFLNWLGDSLDGTLARVRNHRRLRYGLYTVLTVLGCSVVNHVAGDRWVFASQTQE